MNTRSILALLPLLAFSLQPLSFSRAQGSLTPPAGPPVASMKTLDQVEARTPLVAGAPGVAIAANGTITISQRGSYYLTRNLVLPNATTFGIFLSADGINLDLNGFSIIKTGGDGTAISAPDREEISISNGTIVGAATLGNGVLQPGGWTKGVSMGGTVSPISGGNRISKIRVSGIAGYGIEARAGTVQDCDVRICTTGIIARTITNCTASFCGTGIDVTLAGSVSGCFGSAYGSGDGIHAFSCPVTNSKGESESGFGIRGNDLLNCQGKSNSGTGLHADSSATGCSGVSTSGVGLLAVTATSCFGRSTSGTFGMDVTGTASNCRGERPSGTAIRAGIAVACTVQSGTVSSPQKHLGTP